MFPGMSVVPAHWRRGGDTRTRRYSNVASEEVPVRAHNGWSGGMPALSQMESPPHTTTITLLIAAAALWTRSVRMWNIFVTGKINPVCGKKRVVGAALRVLNLGLITSL